MKDEEKTKEQLINELSDLRKREDVFCKSEGEYHRIINTAIEGIWVFDENFVTTFVNNRMADMLGYQPKDLIEKNLECFIFEDDLTDHKEKMEARSKGVSAQYERRFRHKYGSILWTIVSATPIMDAENHFHGSFAMFTDITDRKLAEEDLQRSENLYRDAIEAADAVPYCRDYIANTYEFVGNKIQDLTGYPAEEFTPNLWDSIIQQVVVSGKYKGLPIKEAKFKAHLNGNAWWLDLRIKTRDGEEKWLSDSSIQIRSETGNLIKTLGILQDVTARKLSEEKLQESNRLLEDALTQLRRTQHHIIQQERLYALGQLAGGIAHDFNNKLSPILGYSDLLLTVPEILNDKNRVVKYLEIIKTASEDARNIVGSLREFYRDFDENEVLTPINLNQVVQKAVQLTQPKWRDQIQAKGITINIVTDLQEIPTVNGKEAELREVLTNLILNSVDAIIENGTISISTKADDNAVMLEVSDTGVGMTEEVKKRCFEPFFSTKGLSGTGLGLSIVYGTIRRYNGVIDVYSEMGKGASFIIHLPISKDKIVKENIQKTEEYLKPLHVLVVDDEPMIQTLLGEFLNSDGHTYEVASDGQEGIEKFKAGSFDLVITDKVMPNIGGEQLASMVKNCSPMTPVIMITGFGNIMGSSDNPPTGIDYLLGKPITLNEFRGVLAKLFLHNETMV